MHRRSTVRRSHSHSIGIQMNSLNLQARSFTWILCTRWTWISISLPFHFHFNWMVAVGCHTASPTTLTGIRIGVAQSLDRYFFFFLFTIFFSAFCALLCVQLYYYSPTSIDTLFVRKPTTLKVSFNGRLLANFVPLFDLFCGIFSDYLLFYKIVIL